MKKNNKVGRHKQYTYKIFCSYKHVATGHKYYHNYHQCQVILNNQQYYNADNNAYKSTYKSVLVSGFGKAVCRF